MTTNTVDRLGSDQRERYYARLENRRTCSLALRDYQESCARARMRRQHLEGEIGQIEQSLISQQLERGRHYVRGVPAHEIERRRLPKQRQLEQMRLRLGRIRQEEQRLDEGLERASERLKSLTPLTAADALAGVDSGDSGGSAA